MWIPIGTSVPKTSVGRKRHIWIDKLWQLRRHLRTSLLVGDPTKQLAKMLVSSACGWFSLFGSLNSCLVHKAKECPCSFTLLESFIYVPKKLNSHVWKQSRAVRTTGLVIALKMQIPSKVSTRDESRWNSCSPTKSPVGSRKMWTSLACCHTKLHPRALGYKGGHEGPVTFCDQILLG